MTVTSADEHSLPEGWLLRAIRGESTDDSSQQVDELVCRGSADQPQNPSKFVPRAPAKLEDTKLQPYQLESLILKLLLDRGTASGAWIASQLCLPFGIVDESLRQLKQLQLVAYKGSSGHLGDFLYQLTSQGIEQAQRYLAKSSYWGAAPVPLEDFVEAVRRQSIVHQRITADRLRAALADLIVNRAMLSRLGQALTAGRALFLYGAPGNGKTSIAERLTAAFGSSIWIPRTICIGDDLVQMFDPAVHEAVQDSGLMQRDDIDRRWVKIRRPTVVVGGELTLDHLEITFNRMTGILEAPLQMKSSCGTLVIDDFGRQRMKPQELLNRWIIPLEKNYDFVSLPNGRKIKIPFDQLTVFSTNLDPRDVVDEAFLRRIPYKIKVVDPTEDEFRTLLKMQAERLGIEYRADVVDYLLQTHYRQPQRPLRACHARDLLLQIRNLCVYHDLRLEMTPEYFDIAAENYFTEL